jgi:hypothetical protein
VTPDRVAEALEPAILRFNTRPDGQPGFSWVCPDCGIHLFGTLGDQPVSGWDAPRWVLTGTEDKPTLRPSLGCHNCMSKGQGGHYWLTDGELVPA